MGSAGRVTGVQAGPTAAVACDHDVVLLGAGDEADFGRDPTVALRIGAGPVHDAAVPRRAGRIAIDGDGVLVENLDPHRRLTVVPEGGQPVDVAPRGRCRPAASTFTVLVPGEVATHELLVGMVEGHGLHLRDTQIRLLDAYAAPVERGGLVPTHDQVAAALGLPASTLRARCHEIRGELRLAGVEVRALGDVREEIVEAWTRLQR